MRMRTLSLLECLRRRKFPFRKRSLPFLRTVVATFSSVVLRPEVLVRPESNPRPPASWQVKPPEPQCSVTYTHAETFSHLEFQSNYKSFYLRDITLTTKIHSILYGYTTKHKIFQEKLIQKKIGSYTKCGPGFSC